MKNDSPFNELPQQVSAELQGMSKMSAPAELWDSVSTQLIADKLDSKQAPDELWDAVNAELDRQGGKANRTKVFRLRPIYAAAAGLMVVLGVALQFNWSGSTSAYNPQLAPVLSEAAKAEIRSGVVFIEVKPTEMSATSRNLAVALGGVTQGDAQ
ncbi:MAG: hypothetical protein QGF46_03165 [Planctomycetota bacterium]|jgi:hypothetical protein|nr:hypothetical protein [Planctomycetota bacterium]